MASWSDLYRRDNNLERANASLRNPAARVRVSNMADSKGVVADPILSTIWVSPQILQGRPALLDVYLAEATGWLHTRGWRQRWRIATIAFLGSAILDFVLLYAPLDPTFRLLDAGLASLLFWVGLWGVYGLRKQNKIFREQSLVWARSQLHDFDARQEEAESYRRIVIQNNRYRIKSA